MVCLTIFLGREPIHPVSSRWEATCLKVPIEYVQDEMKISAGRIIHRRRSSSLTSRRLHRNFSNHIPHAFSTFFCPDYAAQNPYLRDSPNWFGRRDICYSTTIIELLQTNCLIKCNLVFIAKLILNNPER